MGIFHVMPKFTFYNSFYAHYLEKKNTYSAITLYKCPDHRTHPIVDY